MIWDTGLMDLIRSTSDAVRGVWNACPSYLFNGLSFSNTILRT